MDDLHLVWHHGKLSDAERVKHLGPGLVVWFTGLSGSGKSTLAREVELALVQNGKHAYVLDGDNVRHGLNGDLDFSPASRVENIRRIGEVSKLFYQANVICLAAFISPYRADRAWVRKLFPEGKFIEVYCAASLEACEARDVKGLYKKARAGEIPEFTGVSAPYEAPTHPELVIPTDGSQTLEHSARQVLDFLKTRAVL